VQSTSFFDDIFTGAQVQMIGIRQYHLGLGIFNLGSGEGFHRSSRPDWHKSRCFDNPVGSMKNTSASVSVTTFTNAVESEIGVIQNARVKILREIEMVRIAPPTSEYIF
jgi:hypothetical protein